MSETGSGSEIERLEAERDELRAIIATPSHQMAGVLIGVQVELSVAGKRRGLAGERSGLFFEFVRVADALVGPGGFEEAKYRAEAKHTVKKKCRQPGNDEQGIEPDPNEIGAWV